MSPAGTSVSAPICLKSSVIKLWQNAITSLSDLPLGSKSLPPLPPPIGSVVSEFLKICSKPRNLIIPRFTDGWKRSPPLYGPIALLNCTLKPLFTCTLPLSSTQGTRNIICLSGSTILSSNEAFSNSGCFSNTGSSDVRTSVAACINSGSLAFFSFNFASTSCAYDIVKPPLKIKFFSHQSVQCLLWFTLLCQSNIYFSIIFMIMQQKI